MKRETTTTRVSEGRSAQFAQLLLTWTFVWLSALLLKAGLSPALRGAFVGAGKYISWSEHAGNFFSQLGAVGTSTMLVVFSLSSLRIDSRLILRLVAAMLASLPTAIVFLAQRATLPYLVTGLAAASAGLVLILGTNLSKVGSPSRWILTLCGASTLLEASGQFVGQASFASQFSAATQQLAEFLVSIATLIAVLMFHHGHALRTAVLLGFGMLMGLASANFADIASPVLFVTARSLSSITGSTLNSALSGALLTISTSLVATNFRSLRQHPLELVVLSVLIAAHAQLTPLTGSVIALGGIFLLAVYGTEAGGGQSPVHPQLVPELRTSAGATPIVRAASELD